MGTSIYILAIKCLAVVGGAVVGGAALGLLLWLLGRWFSPRGVPRPMLRFVRLLGAVAAGWAIWVLVSTEGGAGWGGGGGSLFGGKGSESGRGKEAVAKPTASTKRQAVAPTSRGETTAGETLHVVMLGGSLVKDEKFYVLDDEKDSRTLPELKQAIRDREGKGPVKKLEIVIYPQSVAEGHPAVRDLKRWAEQNNLTAVTVPGKGDLRDRMTGGS